MSSADLFVKIESLPENFRKLVADHVEYLSWLKHAPVGDDRGPKKMTPIPGLLKGKIWIADDFNAPLGDLKGYM